MIWARSVLLLMMLSHAAWAGYGGMANVEYSESDVSLQEIAFMALYFGAAWLFIKETRIGNHLEYDFGITVSMIIVMLVPLLFAAAAFQLF